MLRLGEASAANNLSPRRHSSPRLKLVRNRTIRRVNLRDSRMLLEAPASARMLSEYCEYRRLARRIVLIPTNTALRRKAAEGLVQLCMDGWLRPQHRDRPVAYRVAECVKHFESTAIALSRSLEGFRYLRINKHSKAFGVRQISQISKDFLWQAACQIQFQNRFCGNGLRLHKRRVQRTRTSALRKNRTSGLGCR
jgi:hypothetical protein